MNAGIHTSSFILSLIMPLFDTHAHLDQEEFDADRAEVVRRAVTAGVERVLCVGVDAASSAAAVRLAD
jgi:TatD DNase family protein